MTYSLLIILAIIALFLLFPQKEDILIIIQFHLYLISYHFTLYI